LDICEDWLKNAELKLSSDLSNKLSCRSEPHEGSWTAVIGYWNEEEIRFMDWSDCWNYCWLAVLVVFVSRKKGEKAVEM
jgi:hypothetical protein